MPLGRGVDNCASSLLSASHHFGLPEPIWVYTQCACVARAFTYLSGWAPPWRWLARLGVCFTGSGARSWPGLRLRIPLHKVKKPYPHLLWQEDRVKLLGNIKMRHGRSAPIVSCGGYGVFPTSSHRRAFYPPSEGLPRQWSPCPHTPRTQDPPRTCAVRLVSDPILHDATTDQHASAGGNAGRSPRCWRSAD